MNICEDLLDQVEDMLSKLPVARGTKVKEDCDDKYDWTTDTN